MTNQNRAARAILRPPIPPVVSSNPTGQADERILRLPEVKDQTGLGRSSIYKGVKEKTFPAPCPLGARAVGWLASEISAWVEARKAARQEAAA